MKNGAGRHTFEDGHVYEGKFEKDRMTDYTGSGAGTNGGNFGNEDNPVRKCIDISDLEAFLLPHDCAGLAARAGSGYQDPNKIMREVFNINLRNMDKLKEIYARYRSFTMLPDTDPFLLLGHQLWQFFRDSGIAAPCCPISRLNRAVYSGPRHHSEASPEDMHELKPLTPRTMADRRGSINSHGLTPSLDGSHPPSRGSQDRGSDDGSSLASSLPSPVNAGDEMNDTVELAAHLHTEHVTPSGSFKRGEGAGKMKHVHSPCTTMMFRHFLEAIVRLAVARFSLERGLESQIHRLFKDKLKPLENQQPSDEIFGYFADKTIMPILNEFSPILWQMFEGSSPLSATGVLGSHVQPMHRQLVFGAVQRHFHVNARIDHTIRVKDLLRLLDTVGFLQPPSVDNVPAERRERYAELFGIDHAPIVEPEEVKTETDEDEEEHSKNTEARMSFGSSSLGVGGIGGLGLMGDAKKKQMQSIALEDEDEEDSNSPSKERKSEASAPLESLNARDFAEIDCTISALDVLRIISEVLHPDSLEMLRWEVDALDPNLHQEGVGCLEYAETELVFQEFMRFLVRMADMKTTQHMSLGDQLPLHLRVDGFLRYVFVPALQTPYVPPTTQGDEAAEAEKAEKEKLPEDVKKKSKEEPPVQESPDAEAPVEEAVEEVVAEPAEPVRRGLNLWRGFDDGRPEKELMQAPRKWPARYAREVDKWA